jgi:hypothetical protein
VFEYKQEKTYVIIAVGVVLGLGLAALYKLAAQKIRQP